MKLISRFTIAAIFCAACGNSIAQQMDGNKTKQVAGMLGTTGPTSRAVTSGSSDSNNVSKSLSHPPQSNRLMNRFNLFL